MDALDEELSKLKLLNSRPISPHSFRSSPTTYGVDGPVISGGKVAALANSFQQAGSFTSMPKDVHMNSQIKQISSGGHSPKKVGPIVPPKPQKPLKLPEVPQSMLVKQVCEPLYSKRLQCNSAHNDINMQAELLPSGRPTMLHRKQPTYATSNSLYSKMNKVTLDNPAILEQQLEALAHHKLQLEKKGLLQNHGPSSPSYVPKLSTASFLNEQKNFFNTNASLKTNTVSDVDVYSNFSVKPCSPIYTDAAAANIKSLNVYSNIASNDQQNISNKSADAGRTSSSNMYHSLLYENDAVLEDLPPPPPAVLSIANAEPAEYFKNQNDDEIPPPPSPVSSSYSELRRATDILSKIPMPMPQQQQQIHGLDIRTDGDQSKSSLHYPQCIENTKGGVNSISGTDSNNIGPQTYMNMNYNNEYASFNESPSSQSIGQGSSDYYGYGSFSQGSSTYESIYEPINPRPPSQLSSRSNYLMYVHYVNGPLASECCGIGDDSSGNLPSLTAIGDSTEQCTGIGVSTGGGVDGENHHNPKEAEVKALTDYLVHSMNSSNDVDSYGVCVKCSERVVGENSGCTAMDQVYHISCFTCSQCQINLQGKPFYALEGNPYCEYDYLQTLEKCSVCMKPILERILRATGKPYHPQCFTCVVCGNSLDGIPFTVDATNQNYCISDFHKKFAPRCCVCKQPIMPKLGQEETVRVVALDRSFHFECYKCEDCGLLLSSEAEGRGCYPLDDHVLCKSCNAKRVQMLTNRMTTDL